MSLSSPSATQFAQLLTEAVHRLRLQDGKTVQIVQDELGYALGRQGGSVIEYWRKGHVPPKDADIETLARVLHERLSLERAWLEQLLQYSGYTYPAMLCDALFGAEEVAVEGGVALAQTAVPLNIAPFIAGPPIAHPHRFFGREAALKRIFGLWRHLPLQNVAIVGARRSGKTSLLHYLMSIHTATHLRPKQKRDWLPQAANYQWIFVDFQDPRMGDPERLLTYLLTNMNLPIPTPCRLPHFMDTVSDHLLTPTIILMDEIGAALAAPGLDQQFWWSLRALGTNLTGGNLGFVLASHDPPDQLAYEADKTSPFFNIFGYSVTLGALSEASARQLMAVSPIPFATVDSDWIWEQSGGWPALLQILCHVRLTALQDDVYGNRWREEGLRQMAPYRYLLDGDATVV